VFVCQLEVEVSRCRHLQKQNLSRCITEARDQLAKLWDLCYVGSDERDAFAQFTPGQWTTVHSSLIHNSLIFSYLVVVRDINPAELLGSGPYQLFVPLPGSTYWLTQAQCSLTLDIVTSSDHLKCSNCLKTVSARALPRTPRAHWGSLQCPQTP